MSLAVVEIDTLKAQGYKRYMFAPLKLNFLETTTLLRLLIIRLIREK